MTRNHCHPLSLLWTIQTILPIDFVVNFNLPFYRMPFKEQYNLAASHLMSQIMNLLWLIYVENKSVSKFRKLYLSDWVLYRVLFFCLFILQKLCLIVFMSVHVPSIILCFTRLCCEQILQFEQNAPYVYKSKGTISFIFFSFFFFILPLLIIVWLWHCKINSIVIHLSSLANYLWHN